jgi:hypothetical protein
LVEAIGYNLLHRWFVGLNIDDPVWDRSTFSANRERLFNEDLPASSSSASSATPNGANWSVMSTSASTATSLTPGPRTRVSSAKTTTASHPLGATPRWTSGASSSATSDSGRINKGYDRQAFISGCRRLKVTPHVAAKDKHSSADGRLKRQAGYRQSLRIRKRIEAAFGWIKTVGRLAKTKLIGKPKLVGQALLCFAAYNLVRIGSLSCWWDAHHV